MMKRTFKNLRFSKKKFKGSVDYQQRRQQPIYSFLFNKQSYQYLLAEVLIRVVRELSGADAGTLKQDRILRMLNRHEKRLQHVAYYSELNIPEEVKSDCAIHLERYFQSPKSVSDFKGNILEFYILYIEKYSYKRNKNFKAKVFHESYPHYKRNKKFFSAPFLGDGCDIDIIKVEKYGESIDLIECKFCIDNVIKWHNRGRDNGSFTKKVTYMDMLESELTKIINFADENIKVYKYLATFSESSQDIPTICNNYSVLDVSNELEKFIVQIYN